MSATNKLEEIFIPSSTVTYTIKYYGDEQIFTPVYFFVNYCPFCGHKVEPDWNFCPYCGFDLREIKKSLNRGNAGGV